MGGMNMGMGGMGGMGMGMSVPNMGGGMHMGGMPMF
jgi:hypothetical protein